MAKKRIQEYDEVPHKEESHGLHVLLGLVVLGLLAAYWYFQPAPYKLRAQDLSVGGIHLGDDYQQVRKTRGPGVTDQQMPGGMRNLVYSAKDSFVFKSEHVVFMQTGEAVQLPGFQIKVGDTRADIEKHLGVVEAGRSPQLTVITWPGPDCRLTVEFGPGAKARGLSVYAP